MKAGRELNALVTDNVVSEADFYLERIMREYSLRAEANIDRTPIEDLQENLQELRELNDRLEFMLEELTNELD